MVVCGDCGLPFGINMPEYKDMWYKQDKYEIEWCAKKPITWLFLCGNHSDRDAIKQMPQVEKFGMICHQMKFDNKTRELLKLNLQNALAAARLISK